MASKEIGVETLTHKAAKRPYTPTGSTRFVSFPTSKETRWQTDSGVNNLGKYGRWAFAEFTAVYEIEAKFDELVTACLTGEAA